MSGLCRFLTIILFIIGSIVVVAPAAVRAIPEGESGFVGEMFTNDVTVRGVPVIITIGQVIANFNNDITPDRPVDDIVIAARITNDFCSFFRVGPGGTCKFRLEIDTADRSGRNDEDFGTAEVSAFAFAEFVDPFTGMTDSTALRVAETAVIDDVVPEPTTLILFGTSLAGLGLAARWRRRRQN